MLNSNDPISSREIGGYFELETSDTLSNTHRSFHETVSLTSGRSCLRFLLESLKPKKVFLPFYCCDSVVEPFEKSGIEIKRYALNDDFEIAQQFEITDSDCILYINYFGIKTDYTESLSKQFGDKLWLDNTQAFFEVPPPATIAFNSARKFFGVADGAYVYGTNELLEIAKPFTPNNTPQTEHLYLRLSDGPDAGYESFKQAESNISDSQQTTSEFSDSILSQIDYEAIKLKRRENFDFLNQHLGEVNNLQHLLKINSKNVPFAYPFLPTQPIQHSVLWNRKIFAPVLWPECKNWIGNNCRPTELHQQILPLPMDHRYSSEDMKRIVGAILNA